MRERLYLPRAAEYNSPDETIPPTPAQTIQMT